MDWVMILGWVGAFTGAVVGVPQAYRIIRTRDIEGVSLWTWQIMLALNLAWLVHGVLISAVNMIVVNVIAFGVTTTILVLMARSLRRSIVLVFLPGVLIAAGMVATDVFFGSAVYGFVAAVPAVAGLVTQGIEVVRATSVEGVSAPFLTVATVNFAIWAVWGWLAKDMGTMIANILSAAVSAFNLVWLLYRLIVKGEAKLYTIKEGRA